MNRSPILGRDPSPNQLFDKRNPSSRPPRPTRIISNVFRIQHWPTPLTRVLIFPTFGYFCCSETTYLKNTSRRKCRRQRGKRGIPFGRERRPGSWRWPAYRPCNQSFNSYCTRKRIIQRCCVLCEEVRPRYTRAFKHSEFLHGERVRACSRPGWRGSKKQQRPERRRKGEKERGKRIRCTASEYYLRVCAYM